MFCCSPIWLAVLIVLGGQASAADNVVELNMEGVKLSVVTPVSESFQKQTAEIIQAIPIPVWHTINRAGWKVQIAEFVVDAQPGLLNDRPRGWPADMTWEHTDAIHLPSERLLVLAEKRRNRNGQVVLTSRVPGVLRHELGHAFDMATGGVDKFRSSTAEFRYAYSADVSKMSAEVRSELAYYQQDENAGRQEAFAEAFGVCLGGGSDVPHQDLFQSSFVEVMKFVRQDVDSAYKSEPTAEPDVTDNSVPLESAPPERQGRLFRRFR